MSFADYVLLLVVVVVLRTTHCCLPTKPPGVPTMVEQPAVEAASSVPFVSTVVEGDVLNVTLNYGGPVFKPFTVLLMRDLSNGSRLVATTTVCDDRPSFMIKGLQPSKWYGLSVLSTFQRPVGRLTSLADYRAFDTSQAINRSGAQRSKATSLHAQVSLYNDLIEYKLYSRLPEHFPTLLELRPSCPLPGLPKRLYLDRNQNSATINVTGLENPDGLEVIGAMLSSEPSAHASCQQLCWTASIESDSIIYKYDDDCQLLIPVVVLDAASGNSGYTHIDDSAEAADSSGTEYPEATSVEPTTSATAVPNTSGVETSELPEDGSNELSEEVNPSTGAGEVESTATMSVSEATTNAETTESSEPETVQASESGSSGAESIGSSEAESSGFSETEPAMHSTSGSTESSGTQLPTSSGTDALEPSYSAEQPTEASEAETTGSTTPGLAESSGTETAGGETAEFSGSGSATTEQTEMVESEFPDLTSIDYTELLETQYYEPGASEAPSDEMTSPEPETTVQPQGDGAHTAALSTALALALCLLWQCALMDRIQFLKNSEIYLERKFPQRLRR
uniref:Fibronectin type-III domain-containing protein n=1 Tax=Trichuris muris TaxID=70415 RepID=A0A5S6QPB5_TRIMR